MKVKTKLTKVGDSYYLHVPKSIIDVYNLLKEVYILEVSVYNEGRIISYKRVGKQTKIEDFEKEKKKHGK